MNEKACLLMPLLLAAAANVGTTSAAAVSERFVPSDPGFVVANVARSAPDDDLRRRVAAWQADPEGEAAAQLATAFLERARAQREPMLVGRAESVLARAARGAGATHEHKRLYAETLQFRHDFSAAGQLLDGVLVENPRDSAARTQRASIRLVRGDFAGARADCARLMAGGDAAAPIGAACFAEALAGGGDLERARALLRTWPVESADPAVRAYLLTVRAELGERVAHPDSAPTGSSDLDAAITDYASALKLQPMDDSIRVSLADALATLGDLERARATLRIERPSLALLARQAIFAVGSERTRAQAQAEALLALETARGDTAHAREAAMLALANGDGPRALQLARANFSSQRELSDVRLLARAASAELAAADLRVMRDWLARTGFADAVTETVLANAARR